MVCFPDPMNLAPIFPVEYSRALHHVILELPFELFPIRKFKYPMAFFEILDELAYNIVRFTFVVLPIIIDLIKVAVVKFCIQLKRSLIKEFPMSLELVVNPVPLICQLSGLIVERAIPIHFITFPVSTVQSPILVIKLPFPVPHIIKFISFIPTSLLKSLNYVLCCLNLTPVVFLPIYKMTVAITLFLNNRIWLIIGGC